MKKRLKLNFFWQLSIVFISITLGMGLTMFVVGRLTFNRLESGFDYIAPRGISLWNERIGQYYEQQGSWEGVQAMIDGYPNSPEWGPWDEGWQLNIILTDADGVIVSAPDPERIGETLNDQEAQWATPILVNGEEVGVLVQDKPDAPIPPDNLLGEIFGDPNQHRRLDAAAQALDNFLIVEVIVVAVTLLAGGVLVRKVSRPMGTLVAATRTIGAGNFNVRIPVPERKSEFQELAIAFNTMAKDLERAEIEHQHGEEALRRAKEEAEEAQYKAESANRAKSTFLANMSHELRTPLNAILGFTQLMKHDPTLSAEQQENLATINQSGKHLLTLINDVLEMSKIEAGRIVLSPENFDLNALLDNLESMFHLRAGEKGLQLIFERSADVPQFIHADENKLRQVLINLLSNAIKFTQEGGVTLRVKSTTADQNVTLHFEIEDTGVGIAEEDREHLFEPFVQTASGQESKEGTGLGLPISRQYVQLMGGSFSVKSQIDEGSLFKFTIQAQVANTVATAAEQPSQKVLGLEPNQPAHRLLVVEDREVNRRLLVKLLEPLGFEVREAANGQECIAIWKDWAPHLIWMDMRMPVMNGHEATQHIKATTQGQATTIVALTASAFEEDRVMMLSEGCDDFVRKPFREDDIFKVLTKHLGVRFIYANAPIETAPEEPGSQLTPADLSMMSQEWQQALRQAALELDADRILKLTERIPEANAHLAEALQDLAYNFRFDIIMDLIPTTMR